MSIHNGFIDTVGNTPLIRLATLSDETGCEILGKAEFLNPGGSVKDRAALWMIRAAEADGSLKPGGTVVEGTAGNTGIGIAHICNVRGYGCIIYMPDNQSQEKVDILRTLGAEVRVVKTVPYKDPMNYQKQAGRFAAELPGAVWANQFDNVANRQAHYESTAPEIWAETNGRVDAFTCAVGTGGTLAGVSRYLKEKNPKVRIVLADPPGSALHSWVKTGERSDEPRPLDHGGHRQQPRYRQPGRYADRRRRADQRPADGVDGVPDAARGRLVLRLVDRTQPRGRGAGGAGSRAGAYRGHGVVRRWRQVSVAPLQRRLAGRAGTTLRSLDRSGAAMRP